MSYDDERERQEPEVADREREVAEVLATLGGGAQVEVSTPPSRQTVQRATRARTSVTDRE